MQQPEERWLLYEIQLYQSRQLSASYPQHTWGAMTQPPHAAPGIIPVLLPALDLSLPWSRNMRGSWQRPLCCFLRQRQPLQVGDCAPSLPCGSLGNLSPTAQRLLPFRGVQRSTSTLRIGLSLLPTLGIGIGKSTFVVVLWLQLKRKVAKAVMVMPALQEVSWTPVLPSTGQILGPKSQLKSCWLLTPSTEAEPQCFLLIQVWS